MREGGLAPDVPLGPFEGVPITAYAAEGKTARLHAQRDCSYLRAEQVRRLNVALNAVTIKRMCSQCARWGRWARPGTALGMFLQVFFGYGLVEELDSYTEADPDDDVTEQELVAAAMALWVTGRSAMTRTKPNGRPSWKPANCVTRGSSRAGARRWRVCLTQPTLSLVTHGSGPGRTGG